MKSNICMDTNTNTNIDSFIPKCEIRQQIGLVSDFLFCYFSCKLTTSLKHASSRYPWSLAAGWIEDEGLEVRVLSLWQWVEKCRGGTFCFLVWVCLLWNKCALAKGRLSVFASTWGDGVSAREFSSGWRWMWGSMEIILRGHWSRDFRTSTGSV